MTAGAEDMIFPATDLYAAPLTIIGGGKGFGEVGDSGWLVEDARVQSEIFLR